MQRIHEKVWIYCGHESQVPKAGDYYTVQIGRQPMIMVRGADGTVNVLYNRCPHRGNMIVGDRTGNTGEFFRCSYHAWTFHHDGKLRTIPMRVGLRGHARTARTTPSCSMKHAARVENYRGFVFASLAKDGPTLKEFLGQSDRRLRRHVRPRARGRGRGRAELLPRDPAFELEDIPREPARRAAPVGHAPVDRPRRARGREGDRQAHEERRGAALAITCCRPSRR